MKNIYYEHGYALLIGIRYRHWTDKRPLNGTLNDVKDLNAHFTDVQKAAFNPKNIISLMEENATLDKIREAFHSLSAKIKSDPKASIFVYFSGHGGKYDSNFFLAPYDLDRSKLTTDLENSNAFLAKEFGKLVQSLTAKKSLIVLDCCHAEGMFSNKKGIDTSGFMDGFIEKMDKSITENIPSELNKGRGTVIFTSCEANEESLDMGSNGLFTKVLLECLNGKDNLKKDGWVRLIDIMDYVPKNVKQRALPHPQNPMFKRIEDLNSEDFRICAYDIAQAKGLGRISVSPTPSLLDASELYELLDQGEINEVFNRLNTQNITQKAQYNRLKKEFVGGLSGIGLMDFTDRLKVFIGNL